MNIYIKHTSSKIVRKVTISNPFLSTIHNIILPTLTQNSSCFDVGDITTSPRLSNGQTNGFFSKKNNNKLWEIGKKWGGGGE